jgi:periplasmic protein TonB
MASPKELTPLLPDTLPEDFNEWDGRGSAAPLPVPSGEREAWETADSFSEAAKPIWQSADNDALLASLVDGSRDPGSASSASAFVKQHEDLIDWDSEANPALWPADRTEWEKWEATHSFDKNAKSPGQSGDRETFLTPAGNGHRDSSPASSASVAVQQQEVTSVAVDDSPNSDSHEPEAHPATSEIPATASSQNGATVEQVPNPMEITGSGRRKADDVVFQLFSQKKGEEKAEPKASKKKWFTIAGISVGAILLPLLIMIPLLHHGSKSMAKHSAQPLPGASYTQVDTSTPDQPESKPQPQGKLVPTPDKQQKTDSQPSNQPTNQEAATTPAEVQSTMMNDQLAAPTRIPKQESENAPVPEGSDSAGVEGLGGGSANAGMFNGHAQPTVRASKPVAISSGIATGMLIVKTPPVYPPLAKTAHVAGTVELHATIATNGTIKDLHAVNGPVMLRQAAVDAVRNWRYQPYKLNDQPVEVETTINIVFSLGG